MTTHNEKLWNMSRSELDDLARRAVAELKAEYPWADIRARELIISPDGQVVEPYYALCACDYYDTIEAAIVDLPFPIYVAALRLGYGDTP